MNNNIGERVRQIRNLKSLTQETFAKRICVSRSFVSRMEAGKEKPSNSLLKLIALEFNVSTEWLFDGIGEMKTSKTSYDCFDRDCITNFKDGSIDIMHEFNNLLSNTNSTYVYQSSLGLISELISLLKTFQKSGNFSYIIYEKVCDILIEISYQIQNIENNQNTETVYKNILILQEVINATLSEIKKMYIKKFSSQVE